MEWTTNSLGRAIPTEIAGRILRPYGDMEAVTRFVPGKKKPCAGDCAQIARRRLDKRVASWDELLDRLSIRDGATISFHHHLRNGDRIVNEVVSRLAARGVRGLRLAATSLFPVHDALLPYIRSGVISRIESSMNGSIGSACSHGEIEEVCILRSHGDRQRAIAAGELKIDVAFIAAPCADSFGNANGLSGKSACGPLGYARPDSQNAACVVVITDGLVPYPCQHWSIQGSNVDYVLEVESIGDNAAINFGTTKLTRSPTQLIIAETTARFIETAGIMKDGFSFQAGAGGISLAAIVFLAKRMREARVKAAFAHGGGTGALVGLLNEGLLGSIIDLQSFDLEAVRSCAENPNHIESDPYASYGPLAKGCVADMLDVAILGATEVDIDFNVNVNTHSDGLLLHGIGGHTDAASSAGCTIITAPSFRKRIPVIREKVTTLTCPGKYVDVIVTERGIAINPIREDLVEKVTGSGLPLVSLEELMHDVQKITGVPEAPHFKERPVALVEWRDGSVIDIVRELDV
ncbi:MAG: citrate lyase subunit alpha [Spirochaetaceae bacterium]|nr:citrate lyase subunit alpha [Spirochaetaceae bacterium]